MGVYVDTLKPVDKTRVWPFDDRCRLFADSEQELEGMAASLKLEQRWRVDERASGGLVFYPITGGKRAQAVRLGAKMMSTEMADALARAAASGVPDARHMTASESTIGLFQQGGRASSRML